MLDNIWKSLEHGEEKSVNAEILAWAYFNLPGVTIRDIRKQFDSWTVEQFEEVFNDVCNLPSLEGEADTESMFGVTDWMSRIDFFEGANLQVLPEFFWFNVSKNNKKNKFF